MTTREFSRHWLLVGTPHKSVKEESPAGRRFTGSKGVGRLASQFLGNRFEIRSLPRGSGAGFRAWLSWSSAQRRKRLTRVAVSFERLKRSDKRLAGLGKSGTELRIKELKQEWDNDAIRELADDLWMLQSPTVGEHSLANGSTLPFSIAFSSDIGGAESAFQRVYEAVFKSWDARIIASLSGDKAEAVLEFQDGTKTRHTYKVPAGPLSSASLDLRVFKIKGRQPEGIPVSEVRRYLNRHGGIHVYDAGFHLPYYGPEVDWLGVEQDHAHRLVRSKLLPESLHVPGGLTFLPTQSRLLGFVDIDTGHERSQAEANDRDTWLSVQVSRDRLVDNESYKALRHFARLPIDLYAMEAKRRAAEREKRRRAGTAAKSTSTAAREVRKLVEELVDTAPPADRDGLRKLGSTLTARVRDLVGSYKARSALLGELATGGMFAVAQEHEFLKHSEQLSEVASKLEAQEISRADAASHITEWLRTALSMRSLFTHLVDPTARRTEKRFRVRRSLRTTATNFRPLLACTEVQTALVPPDLRFPSMTMAEITSILQNIYSNAVNAVRHEPVGRRAIRCKATLTTKHSSVVFSNRGETVDIETAERLFEPFVRGGRHPEPGASATAIGGMGMGLTIVRMLCERRQIRVRFVPPDSDFSTALELRWRIDSSQGNAL